MGCWEVGENEGFLVQKEIGKGNYAQGLNGLNGEMFETPKT
jgi:hypothetical protein